MKTGTIGTWVLYIPAGQCYRVFFGPENARVKDLFRVPGLGAFVSPELALQAWKTEFKAPNAYLEGMRIVSNFEEAQS